MQQLKNIDHSFDVALGDVGCTIRKGSKWFDWAKNNWGKEMELRVCPSPHTGECNSLCINAGVGKIIGYWKGALSSLPPALLSIEHNTQARNREDLKIMLEQGYGSIDEADIVTAIIYIRTVVNK